MPSKFIGVRMPKDLAVAIEAAARNDNRSVSNYLVNLVAQDIERRRAADDDNNAQVAQENPVRYSAKRPSGKARKTGT